METPDLLTGTCTIYWRRTIVTLPARLFANAWWANAPACQWPVAYWLLVSEVLMLTGHSEGKGDLQPTRESIAYLRAWKGRGRCPTTTR
jgi:hypothetical protein